MVRASVLFTRKHTVTNIMSVHGPNADERLLPPHIRPQEPTSRYRFRPDNAVKEFTTNDSWNRDSEQPRRYEHRYKKQT